MDTTINRRSLLGLTIAAGAFGMLAPAKALGVTASQKQEEVRAVKTKLESIADEASAAGDRYHKAMDTYEDATRRVEEAQSTIDEMSSKIVTLQERLDARAASMYRSGSTSYLEVLLGVSSFSDFATVWDTLNDLNADDADLVASTKVTKSTLEAAQSELVEQQQVAASQLDSAKSSLAEVQARQDEYDRIYNELSEEYRQILHEQEAAEAQASARAPQQSAPPVVQAPSTESQSAPADQGGSNSSPSSSSGSSSSASAPATSVSPKTTATTTQSAPSLPTNASVLDYAYSKIGCPYVWGAKGPDSFDCSGFVAWCYRQIGVSLPSYTESLYATAKARFAPSEAQPGDILYKPGHVGISTGGLNCVEAMGSRWGVVTSCRGGWTAALRF